ncbi:MAG: ROK family protein [Planctomycetota bacterium]|jgi:glucokinase
MKELFLGIDLGGTNVKVGCFDSDLNMIGKISKPTDAELGPEAVINKICDTVYKLLEESKISMDAVKAVGIGAPGPSKISEGIIISAPNMPNFRNVPIRDILSKKLGKPAVYENDANAACWAEHVVGAGKGAEDMLFFTLGTGIGGGVISNGELVHGYRDNAAELGHIIIHKDGRPCGCGQQGCVEAYASASSTAKRATEAIEANAKSSLGKVLKEKGKITCKDVFEHYAAGDKLATNVAEGTCSALGLLCVSLLHVTGPKRIVFAGGMIAAGDILLQRINHFFKQYIWPLKEENLEICFATLGADAGIIGSAALALHEYNKGRL